MKYIAPKVLNSLNATALIQGSKNGVQIDSANPQLMPSTGGAYLADE